MHVRGIKKTLNRKGRPRCMCFSRLWLKKQHLCRFGGSEGQSLLLSSPVSTHGATEEQALAMSCAAGVCQLSSVGSSVWSWEA